MSKNYFKKTTDMSNVIKITTSFPTSIHRADFFFFFFFFFPSSSRLSLSLLPLCLICVCGRGQECGLSKRAQRHLD